MRLPTYAVLLLATVGFGGLTLGYPVGGWDIPTYSYIASVIREGGVPYRDAWDLKSPGIFFAHAIGQVVLGTSPVAVRMFDLLWQFATSLLLAHAAMWISRKPTVGQLAGSLYLLTYFARNGWDWAQPDSFVALPLAAAIGAALRGRESGRLLPWAVAGMSIGVATLLKPPFGLLGIALLFLAATGTGRRTGATIASWLALAAGLATPLSVCLAYFWVHGAVGDLWTAQFVLAPEYVMAIRAYRSMACLFRAMLQPVNAPVHVMGLLALSFVARLVWRKQENLRAPLLVLAWAGTAVAALMFHGKYDSMHFVSLLAPLAVLSAAALDRLWSFWREERKWLALVALIALAATLVVPANKLLQHARLLARRTTAGDVQPHALHQLGRALRERTTAEDRIFVWGNTPALYYYAQRRSMSRFIHTYFLAKTWAGVDLRPVLLQEWRAQAPEFFVLVKFPRLAAAGQPTAFFQCQPEPAGMTEGFLQFDELRSRVEKDYTVAADTPDYVLYQRRHEGVGGPPGAGR